MKKFEAIVTATTAAVMTRAVSILVVTASAEQIPSTWSANRVVVEQRIDEHVARLGGCHQTVPLSCNRSK